MLFHIKFPVAGANFVMVTDFVISPAIDTIIMVSLIILILSVRIRIKPKTFYIPIYRIKKLIPPLAVLLPFTGVVILAISLDVPKYISTLDDDPSTFYEEYYINPAAVNIIFPEKKEESYSYFRRISRNRFSDN
jgi:hypothetical protein